MSVLHVGDTGTWVGIDMGFDTTAAIARVILLSDPVGTTTSHAATTHSQEPGVIRFTTLAGTLNAAGAWRIQGNVQTADGQWSSRSGRFKVYSVL